MARITKPEPITPRSHVTLEKEAAVPEELLSTPSSWAKMFSFPLPKMLPVGTNLTPPTGGDKSPVVCE